jgi:hypothetical protein
MNILEASVCWGAMFLIFVAMVTCTISHYITKKYGKDDKGE